MKHLRGRKKPQVHQNAIKSTGLSPCFSSKSWKFMFFGDDSKTLCFGRGQKCLIVLKQFLIILIREANWSRELDAAPGFIASNLDSDCSVSQKKPPHCPNKPPHLYIPKIKLRILSNSDRNHRFTMLLINEEHSNSTGNTQESISSVSAVQFSKKVTVSVESVQRLTFCMERGAEK